MERVLRNAAQQYARAQQHVDDIDVLHANVVDAKKRVVRLARRAKALHRYLARVQPDVAQTDSAFKDAVSELCARDSRVLDDALFQVAVECAQLKAFTEADLEKMKKAVHELERVASSASATLLANTAQNATAFKDVQIGPVPSLADLHEGLQTVATMARNELRLVTNIVQSAAAAADDDDDDDDEAIALVVLQPCIDRGVLDAIFERAKPLRAYATKER